MAYLYLEKSHLIVDMKSHVVEVIFDVEGQRRAAYVTLHPSWITEAGADVEGMLSNHHDPKSVPVWDVRNSKFSILPIDKVFSAQTVNW